MLLLLHLLLSHWASSIIFHDFMTLKFCFVNHNFLQLYIANSRFNWVQYSDLRCFFKFCNFTFHIILFSHLLLELLLKTVIVLYQLTFYIWLTYEDFFCSSQTKFFIYLTHLFIQYLFLSFLPFYHFFSKELLYGCHAIILILLICDINCFTQAFYLVWKIELL